jgi:hypothetical protein
MIFGLTVTAVALAVTALAALAGCLIDRSDAANEHIDARELIEGKRQ